MPNKHLKCFLTAALTVKASFISFPLSQIQCNNLSAKEGILAHLSSCEQGSQGLCKISNGLLRTQKIKIQPSNILPACAKTIISHGRHLQACGWPELKYECLQ